MTDAPLRFINFEKFKALTEFPRYPNNKNICTSMDFIDRNNSLIIFISHKWVLGSAPPTDIDFESDSECPSTSSTPISSPMPSSRPQDQDKDKDKDKIKTDENKEIDQANGAEVTIDGGNFSDSKENDKGPDNQSIVMSPVKPTISPRPLQPRPDDKDNNNFRLCIAGIQRIKTTFAPGLDQCYVWLDNGCLNQDEDPAAELNGRLDEVMKFCDCIFTPIVGVSQSKNKNIRNYYEEYRVRSWNGENGYLSCAWCRIEMFFASQVPLVQKKKRANTFRFGMQLFISTGRRPHLLYSSSQMIKKLSPVILPPISPVLYNKYDPQMGSLLNERDRPRIEQLVSILNGYSDPDSVYTDDYTAAPSELDDADDMEPDMGVTSDKTVIKSPQGDIYEGAMMNGKKHGYGVLKAANGDVYDGDWKDDRKNGYGVIKYASGALYAGEYQDDLRHGKGVYKFASGAMYEGDVSYHCILLLLLLLIHLIFC